jgi:hypothetical protein
VLTDRDNPLNGSALASRSDRVDSGRGLQS